METGSNKSLFTLIAVVIFGIFLSLSYWLFKDELTSVLGSVIDKTSESINNDLIFGINSFADGEFRGNATLSNFQGRTTTLHTIDKVNLYNGSNTLKIDFKDLGAATSYQNDFVFFLPDDFNDSKIGSYVKLKFKAKSTIPLTLSTRLGGDFFNSDLISNTKLSTGWREYRITIEVTQNANSDYPCAVMWSDKVGTVWLADLEMISE